MSSDESYSEFHGFNAVDFDVTSHTALDNLSDINVSSVKTDDLPKKSKSAMVNMK